MIFYYKTTDETEGEVWKKADSSEYEDVKTLTAKHIGIYHLSEDYKDGVEIQYKGDFWIDIDHSVAGTANKNFAIEQSIDSVRKIQDYLRSISVSLESCELFISGGKGFHVRIPAEVFGASKRANLPLVYKEVALQVIADSGATGVDKQMYNMKRGKLIRVEDKQRPNGLYKVQISWSELDNLGVESYFSLAAKPRGKVAVTPPLRNKTLVALFNSAVKRVKDRVKLDSIPVVEAKFMTSLAGEPPTCIQKICAYDGVKENVNFNSAKMTIARYLAVSNLSAEKMEKVISDFCTNYPSDSKRPKEKENALRAILSWGESEESKNGFSCQYIKSILHERPCRGCPVESSRLKEVSYSEGITANNGCYYNLTKKGDPNNKIGWFNLIPIRESYDTSPLGEKIDIEFMYELRFEDPQLRPRLIELSITDFQSKSALLKGLRHVPQALWIGSDNEVQYLKAFLTKRDMVEGVEVVKRVKKLGVQRIVDKSREEVIDEYVWVQDNWSINGAGVTKTVSYRGALQEGDTSELVSPIAQLDKVDAVETEQTARTFKAMLQSRDKMDMAIIMGWMCACWVKQMLQTGEYQDSFPLLHVHGEAGSGKTETSKTMSIFGGNDGIHGSVVSVSGVTSYFLKAEASSTTSVPRIFDEFHKNKIEPKKYSEAVDTFKMAGTKGSKGNGKVKDVGGTSKTITEVTVMSSPVVYMGTVRTDDEELLQRSVVLEFAKSAILDQGNEFTKNYNYVCERKSDLYVYTKMLMLCAVKITPERLKELWSRTEWVLKGITDHRKAKGLRCVHLGLELAIEAFTEANCSEETIELVRSLIPYLETYRKHTSYRFLFDTHYNEADRVVTRLFELTMIADNKGEGNILKEGIHYTVDETYIHIQLLSAWLPLISYSKTMNYLIEFPSKGLFLAALSGAKYYKGSGLAVGVKNPDEWHALSIEHLIDKGISTTMFVK